MTIETNSPRFRPENVFSPFTYSLLDDPSEVQKDEFLFEIAMMKLLGAHQNIVSLVGCCTLQEHKFLVIEYVPFGDLLQWLRRKRSTVWSDYILEHFADQIHSFPVLLSLMHLLRHLIFIIKMHA